MVVDAWVMWILKLRWGIGGLVRRDLRVLSGRRGLRCEGGVLTGCEVVVVRVRVWMIGLLGLGVGDWRLGWI